MRSVLVTILVLLAILADGWGEASADQGIAYFVVVPDGKLAAALPTGENTQVALLCHLVMARPPEANPKMHAVACELDEDAKPQVLELFPKSVRTPASNVVQPTPIQKGAR